MFYILEGSVTNRSTRKKKERNLKDKESSIKANRFNRREQIGIGDILAE
jgi:hypothetical protein